MKFSEFEKCLEKIKKDKRVNKDTEVYIDCFECLTFNIKSSELVLDLNDNEYYER